MKELYISPELKVTCFAPVERLAAEASTGGGIDFDDLLDAAGQKDPAIASKGDFGFGL